jgi:hypothetical protein
MSRPKGSRNVAAKGSLGVGVDARDLEIGKAVLARVLGTGCTQKAAVAEVARIVGVKEKTVNLAVGKVRQMLDISRLPERAIEALVDEGYQLTEAQKEEIWAALDARYRPALAKTLYNLYRGDSYARELLIALGEQAENEPIDPSSPLGAALDRLTVLCSKHLDAGFRKSVLKK